jgi:hypothetical protein
MNSIIELNNEFESSPFIVHGLSLQKNIFENESISDFNLIYNDFISSLMSSDITIRENEMNYSDYYMNFNNPEEENKFYLNLNLDLDEDKINENIIHNRQQNKVNKKKKKNNIISDKKNLKIKNMIKINLNKEDIFNNQILKKMFIQYLNQKRSHFKSEENPI